MGMDARLPLNKEVLARTPPGVVRLLVELLDRIDKLERQNAALKARWQENSSNLSKPPSSEPLCRKRCPPEPPSGRSRGGQSHHPLHKRPLVPPEHVDDVVECRPTDCELCGAALAGDDPEPQRR
jgi:transposase